MPNLYTENREKKDHAFLRLTDTSEILRFFLSYLSRKQKPTYFMNIIVPTDFTATSLNAAQFGARMLAGQYDANLILLHVYEDSKKEAEVKQKLRELKDRLADEGIVKIECVAEQQDDLIEALEKKVRHLDASLVVMSITERSKVDKVLNGSNSLRMIESNLCPVLVIPHNAKFSEIKNVALASD